jgi:hypothetical protein
MTIAGRIFWFSIMSTSSAGDLVPGGNFPIAAEKVSNF